MQVLELGRLEINLFNESKWLVGTVDDNTLFQVTSWQKMWTNFLTSIISVSENAKLINVMLIIIVFES